MGPILDGVGGFGDNDVRLRLARSIAATVGLGSSGGLAQRIPGGRSASLSSFGMTFMGPILDGVGGLEDNDVLFRLARSIAATVGLGSSGGLA